MRIKVSEKFLANVWIDIGDVYLEVFGYSFELTPSENNSVRSFSDTDFTAKSYRGHKNLPHYVCDQIKTNDPVVHLEFDGVSNNFGRLTRQAFQNYANRTGKELVVSNDLEKPVIA